jgi:hypothetical protein
MEHMRIALALSVALLPVPLGAQDRAGAWRIAADRSIEFSWRYCEKSETSDKKAKISHSDAREVDGRLRATKSIAGEGLLDAKLTRVAWSLDAGDYELSLDLKKGEIVRCADSGDVEKAAKARLKTLRDQIALDYQVRASSESESQFGFRAAKGFSGGRIVASLFTGAYVHGSFPESPKEGQNWYETVFGVPGVVDAGVESEMLRMRVTSAAEDRFTAVGEMKKNYNRQITSCVTISGTITIRREYTFLRSGLLASSREDVRFTRRCVDELHTVTLVQELALK